MKTKTLLMYNGDYWGIRLEFKLQDMWCGLFWINRKEYIDVWICIIPCLPIHYWSGRKNYWDYKASQNSA